LGDGFGGQWSHIGIQKKKQGPLNMQVT
jgi:hypothetical protein